MAYSRILAFFVSTNDATSPAHQRALAHLRQLTDQFGCNLTSVIWQQFTVWLCFTGDLDKLCENTPEQFTFTVGRTAELQRNHQGIEPIALGKTLTDRFLYVRLQADATVTFVSDYAGTIPCFYSARQYLSASNIEPVVVLDSNARADDLDPIGIYELFRFMHLVWDRTLFQHVSMQEPDSILTWRLGSDVVKQEYVGSVHASSVRQHYSDRRVAQELYELNQQLVTDSLAQAPSIILPLSSGYDSRMIFVGLATTTELRNRLRTFTYGAQGSIEVKAARQLTDKYGVKWQQVDLPCNYLEQRYLQKIGLVFGSSLHFHGMYQLEFAELIQNEFSSGVFTSGYLTGVPAGQHISQLGLNTNRSSPLVEAMGHFVHSTFWADVDLAMLSTRFEADMVEAAEQDFRKAFNRFEGDALRKSIMLDIWTRQRNFISYHPRVFEWLLPVLSPHACVEYANFFMSLSNIHLTDRLAVELMFSRHYQQAAHIPSNSAHNRALLGHYNQMRLAVKVLQRAKVDGLLPKSWVAQFTDESISFDRRAIEKHQASGVWPLFSLSDDQKSLLEQYVPARVIVALTKSASHGNERDYNRLRAIQALAYAVQQVI